MLISCKSVVLLTALQALDALFVDLRYVHQAGQTLHDFPEAAVTLFVFLRHLPVFRRHQFDGLCERFMPFGQPLESFLYAHLAPINVPARPSHGAG